MGQLAGKAALVTGAGRGIGRATALALAKDGARVAALDVEGEGAAETARLVKETGVRAIPLTCDITDRAQVQRAIAEAVAALGAVDILVNNAGAFQAIPFEDAPAELVDREIAVNLTGHLAVSQAVVPGMVARRYGRIVNIGSEAGLLGAGRALFYATAKGGLIAFTKSLAKELAPHAITVNCVCPGPTDTPMWPDSARTGSERAQAFLEKIPMKRMGKPEEVAAAVAFLASDRAAYVTGLILGVDGGLSRAP